MAKKSAPVTPLQKALDTLYTISGAPPIDVDNIINDLLKNTEKNLANQTQAYNSELYNRERSRLGASGYSREEQDRLINDYVERNKLK